MTNYSSFEKLQLRLYLSCLRLTFGLDHIKKERIEFPNSPEHLQIQRQIEGSIESLHWFREFLQKTFLHHQIFPKSDITHFLNAQFSNQFIAYQTHTQNESHWTQIISPEFPISADCVDDVIHDSLCFLQEQLDWLQVKSEQVQRKKRISNYDFSYILEKYYALISISQFFHSFLQSEQISIPFALEIPNAHLSASHHSFTHSFLSEIEEKTILHHCQLISNR